MKTTMGKGVKSGTGGKLLLALALLPLAGMAQASVWTVESAGSGAVLVNEDWRMTLDQTAKITGISAISDGGGG